METRRATFAANARRTILCCALLCAPFVGAVAQSVQYRSPAGVEYRAQADTGPIARAESALAADSKNVQKFIALGVAQSGARQFREAIATFTRGLAIAPNEAMLYRWRGHRYLSVREFDKAMSDLKRGYALDSTNYGILYHLGVLRFSRGEFSEAARLFAKAQPRAPDAGELAGSTDWLWMSLARAGRMTEATAMLARHPDSLKTTPGYAYTQRLKLYRGEVNPATFFTPADTADVQVATLNYGLGNWYMAHGDTAHARAAFETSVKSGGWPGFGFIVSEAELARLKQKGAKPETQTKPNTLSAAEKAAGWRLLFDGASMKGWHGLGFPNVPAGLWVIEDGAIKHLIGGKGPVQADGQPLTGMDLVSDNKYSNFELSWEWKIAETGNSGLKYNVDEALSTAMSPPHAAKGWEYQMLDDDKAEDNKLATHRSGALYEMFPAPDSRKLNVAGQWNRSRIVFNGKHGEHWLNGEKVVEFDIGSAEFDAAFAKSKYSKYPEWFAVRRAGQIVLQDHDGGVWFRDIKIREIK